MTNSRKKYLCFQRYCENVYRHTKSIVIKFQIVNYKLIGIFSFFDQEVRVPTFTREGE